MRLLVVPKTLGPRMRGDDANPPSSFPRTRGSSDANPPASFPRTRESSDANPPASFPRTRESSVVAAVAVALLLCAAPLQAEEWVSLEKSEGSELFGEKCGMCHRATGMGTGILARRMTAELALLENRPDLQPDFVRTVVRNGFGVMFPISRAEVSDPQLEKLVEYLVKEGTAQ